MHPIVSAAAEGDLPDWAVAGVTRREHMTRVANLMEQWARALGLGSRDVATWRAAGQLHDVFRNASPEALLSLLPRSRRKLPPAAHHGAAAAATLKNAGVADTELLHAVRWHTLGSKSFRRLGKALYAADFLEPGRRLRRRWRARLRQRAPDELDHVLVQILSARIGYLLQVGLPVHRRTVGFWNSLVDGR